MAVSGPTGLVISLMTVGVASWLAEHLMVLIGKGQFAGMIKILAVIAGFGIIINQVLSMIKTIGGLLGV